MVETVVLFLLPHGQFIGALIVFRVVYFLVPLCIGIPLFAVTEFMFRQKRRRMPAASVA